MGFSAIPPNSTINSGTSRSDWTKLEWTSREDLTNKNKGTSTYKGGSYCGPGWGFSYQDILSGKIKTLPKALDAIDEACKLHDYCYTENGYFTRECNLVLTVNLLEVVVSDKSTNQQRLDAVIMAAIFAWEALMIDGGAKPIALSVEKMNKLRGSILSSIYSGGMSLQGAIEREILRGVPR
ncbi:hypothetical protein [Methylorubrum extorquens]|uniref:Uncharacterized protein n=1 Tax=Methylorubrum extorquens TaxID=408 RepID=A0AAX3WCV2_METEX|nr:hypothetical protein [Methylorubrum extorquens]WHQ68569.1 hypothetical protein KEC54_19615 [Methylorubrum extorquens]